MVKRYLNIPVYNLVKVKSLADQGMARWRGRSAQTRCQDDLGLSFDQVCEEISWLDESDYDKTYRYPGNQPPDDGYEIVILDIHKNRTRAYIKLRIDPTGGLVLDIGSFHG